MALRRKCCYDAIVVSEGEVALLLQVMLIVGLAMDLKRCRSRRRASRSHFLLALVSSLSFDSDALPTAVPEVSSEAPRR